MLNNTLRFLRQEKKVSQQDLADYLKITRQAYNNYETGKREPDYETLLKLGEYFNVSVDYLVRGENTPDPSDIVPSIKILARHIEDIPDEDRNQLVSNIESTIMLYLRSKGLM